MHTPQAVSWLFAWHEAAWLVGMQTNYWGPAGEGAAEGLRPGDVLASNHPQLAGGSHLPDITVITPVFNKGRIEYASCDLAITSGSCKECPAHAEWAVFCRFFVASRGHHADVGGITPGSMPPNSRRLVEEGAAIIAYKLVREGRFQVPACGVLPVWLFALCGSSLN